MRTLFQVDLLIATCGLASAGHVRDAANVLPCVGNNPYTESGAECSTEMQLYSGLKDDMIVLQQRAPPMLGRYALQCLMPQFACLLVGISVPLSRGLQVHPRCPRMQAGTGCRSSCILLTAARS